MVWRYSAPGNLPPRVTPFVLRQPIGAHTDAQGHGHIAAVYTGHTHTTVSLRIPDWLIELVRDAPVESPIFIYELCAAILMVCIAREWPRQTHQTYVLCVDNVAAVDALVNGSSTSPIGTLLTTLFRNLAARGATLWRIEYVRTKSNHADQPSRECDAQNGSRCIFANGSTPSSFYHAFKSWCAIHKEETTAQKAKR